MQLYFLFIQALFETEGRNRGCIHLFFYTSADPLPPPSPRALSSFNSSFSSSFFFFFLINCIKLQEDELDWAVAFGGTGLKAVIIACSGLESLRLNRTYNCDGIRSVGKREGEKKSCERMQENFFKELSLVAVQLLT